MSIWYYYGANKQPQGHYHEATKKPQGYYHEAARKLHGLTRELADITKCPPQIAESPPYAQQTALEQLYI